MPSPASLRRVAPLAVFASALALFAVELPAQWISTSTHQKDKPPYYHGKRPVGGARIAWAPLMTPAMQAKFTRSGSAPSGEMQLLLDTLNARLAQLMGESPRVPDERLATLLDGAPEIVFGCEPDFGSEGARVGKYYHSAGCKDLEKGAKPHNALIVQNPSKQWRERAGASLVHDSAEYLLMLSLRIGDQYPWSGWNGKGVRLGSGYDASLPWLSAIDRPVTVVQLVGTVVNREGKVVRSGAEGLFASKPGALVTILGGQQAVSDAQLVELLLATRRNDLPGAPLAWEVGLRTLVSELTNRDPVVIGAR